MPLTHVIASAACVVAALVMLGTARGPASRIAHLVVAATMGVLAFAMGDPAVVVGAVVVLAVTGALLWGRHREPEARSCAVDVLGSAALVGLMGVAFALAPAPEMPGMPGMHHTATAPGWARPLLLTVALVLLTGWALARRATRDPDARRSGTAAAWLMMLAMTAMAAG